MKIGLVILHADPNRGGAERYTIDLAAALRGAGHDVALLASTFAPEHRHPADIRLASTGATRTGRYLRFLGSLETQLSCGDYEIVHAMLPVRRCDIYHPHAGIAAEAVGGFNPRRRKFAAIERELLTSPNPPLVLCLSEYVKRFVTRHYDLPPDKLATLFNAIDLPRFDPQAPSPDRQRLRAQFQIAPEHVAGLMIAQDFERKGLAEAIRAVATAQDPRLRLLVVGKQDPRAYRELAAEHDVAGQVIFAGSTSDPRAFYRAADFLVLPTRHDPCSLVVLEALAMGLPVISTVFNGACEIMQDGMHGFILSDPCDISALARGMRELFDPVRRKAMSDACLVLRPRLAYEHHLQALLRIYDLARGRAISAVPSR